MSVGVTVLEGAIGMGSVCVPVCVGTGFGVPEGLLVDGAVGVVGVVVVVVVAVEPGPIGFEGPAVGVLSRVPEVPVGACPKYW